MTKGRNVPELETFTFDSGKTCRIRPVSPMLSAEVLKDWRKKNPAPTPPLEEVEVMGIKTREPNFSNRGYILAMAAYQETANETVGFLTLRMMVKRGVELNETEEEVAAEVAQLRADMTAMGVDLDPDDKYIYVTTILAGTSNDMDRLRDAIMTRSQPTPPEVNDNITTFPGNVQG